MARRRPSSEDDQDMEERDLDEEDEQDEERVGRRIPPSARHPLRHPGRGRPRPIKTWSKRSGTPNPARSKGSGEERPPVFWRARDSLYFGPLVGLAIVVVLVASLFAFTQNWPPVYVVESNSMQHGSSDVLGLINTGDLVLAQKVPASAIETYVVAAPNGYSTYGEPGDVLLYQPDGGAATPVIHRAIVYLEWDSVGGGYNATGLAGQPCGTEPGAVYSTPTTNSGCGTTDLTSTLDLFNVGWTRANLSINLQSPALGRHSGFITMGDNNTLCNAPGSCVGFFDQSDAFDISQLVEPAWIVGVARGMIPWFGAVKLWIEQSGTLGEVPPQSWQFIGLTVAGLVAIAFGLHFALRAEGVEDPRRKSQEEEAEEDAAEERSERRESAGRRFLHSIRPWGRVPEDADEDGEEDEGPRRVHHARGKLMPRPRHGRPKPRVRRAKRARRREVDDEDEES